MRDIKFRAWDKENKCFLHQLNTPVYIQLFGDVIMDETGNKDFADLSHRIEIEQYTGLKDKNGKEIYEGDILKSEQYKDSTFTVRWTKGGFVINTPIKKWKNDLYPFEALAELQNKSWVEQTCEIIGNIHEQ